MKRHILTEEDIKKVLDNAVTGNVREFFNRKGGKIVPATVKVSNGYNVSMTINDSGGIKMRHIEVNNPGGLTDPAESDAIASDILGTGYQIIPGATNPNIFHYLKPEPKKEPAVNKKKIIGDISRIKDKKMMTQNKKGGEE